MPFFARRVVDEEAKGGGESSSVGGFHRLEKLSHTSRLVETTVKDRNSSQAIVARVTESVHLRGTRGNRLNRKKLVKAKKVRHTLQPGGRFSYWFQRKRRLPACHSEDLVFRNFIP